MTDYAAYNKTTKDYTQDPNFWIRLQIFVSGTNVNCAMDEEEKEMILHNCKLKIHELTDIELSDDEFEKKHWKSRD